MMHPIFLTATVVLSNIPSILGSSFHQAIRQSAISTSPTASLGAAALEDGEVFLPMSFSSKPHHQSRKDQAFLPQHALLVDSEDSRPQPHPIPNPMMLNAGMVIRDANDASTPSLRFYPQISMEHELETADEPPVPIATTDRHGSQAIAVDVRNEAVVQHHHPVTVPQMQSTMAPIEAAQTLRSFQSAQSSISAMSEAAIQKGRAGATLAAAASSASASLAKSHKELEKSLVKSCKGNTECEKFYKDEMRSSHGKHGKQDGKNDAHHRHHNDADTVVQFSTVVVALSTVMVAFALL